MLSPPRAPSEGACMAEVETRDAAKPAAWTESQNAFPFDPSDPVFRADPYPTYNDLRETRPVLRSLFGMLVLSRHKDCVALLHHPQTSTDQRNSEVFKAYLQSLDFDPFEGRE